MIGFISVYAKNISGKFEYIFESFEYILLISGPLLIGTTLVIDQEIKNYFLIAYFPAILGWFIFWVFVKKWNTKDEEEQVKTRMVKPFAIDMFIGFSNRFTSSYKVKNDIKRTKNHYNVKLLRGYILWFFEK